MKWIVATFGAAGQGAAPPSSSRIEPMLADDDEAGLARTSGSAGVGANIARSPAATDEEAESDFVAPIDFAPQALAPAPVSAERAPLPAPAAALGPVPRAPSASISPQPDPDIECVVAVQPVHPVAVGALATGMHARVGKPLRWFGRNGAGSPWQLLRPETAGTYSELAACLLLADRAGAATRPMLERLVRLVGDVAASLPGASVAPDVAKEVARAEALDRFCANLDVQIGLTVLKAGAATIPGTRLRGVAEAAGFRLSENGRFEFMQEDTGAVLFSMQNYRSEPFTIDNLRLTSTPGAVFLLDVPRVADAVRVFDQMKQVAKRITQTLDGTLVDDNRRPLTDASLAAIREQVEATANALRESRLDPGSPRAMALFGG